MTQNSLPHCTGSSSGNSLSAISTKFCSTSGRRHLFLPKTPYLSSTKHNTKVTETQVPLNATMAPQGYMITVYHITNVFYKYRRLTNFVRICIVSNPVLLLFFFGSVDLWKRTYDSSHCMSGTRRAVSNTKRWEVSFLPTKDLAPFSYT